MSAAPDHEFSTVQRPDGRLFARVQGVAPDIAREKLTALIASSTVPVAANVDVADEALVHACVSAGMEIEVTTTRYQVPFAGALERFSTDRASKHYEVVGADHVSADDLFVLDNRLRQDVPGTDGWRGNRAWFDDELASTDFDPTGYLVGRHVATAELVGLVRFWREPGATALGLLAVLPKHRNRYVSVQLLVQGLRGASAWGHEHFRTSSDFLRRVMVTR